jgi:Flp pilus assembly protein CpaB
MTYRVRNIVLAVALAALAAMLTTFYVANYKRTVQKAEKNVPVFVAAQDIAAGTSGAEAFDGGLLETREIPRRSVVPGAISSPEEVENLVSTDAIHAGEQVTARRFRPAEEGGIRAQLSGNLRAVQIAGDQNQILAGTLRKGDHVDVLAALKYQVKDIRPAGEDATVAADMDRIASRVVLRDLLVLKAPSGSLTAEKVGGPIGGGYAVQLAVTDAQAQKLFFVTTNADWSLQLRPVTDAEDSPESVETLESVLGDGLRESQFLQLYGGRRGGR